MGALQKKAGISPIRRRIIFVPLHSKMNGTGSAGNGVEVSGVTEDPSAFNLVYDPENPDANKDGYVQKPNVDPLKEMVDLVRLEIIRSKRNALNASKGMLLKALEIGK